MVPNHLFATSYSTTTKHFYIMRFSSPLELIIFIASDSDNFCSVHNFPGVTLYLSIYTFLHYLNSVSVMRIGTHAGLVHQCTPICNTY